MVEDEAVLLDEMTGFEFETFFAHLLERLGYGQVEQVRTARDEGQDIRVRSPQGLIVVECKHWPGGSIGRPVVQKLHSAVDTSGAARGMLVTTGHFTPDALDYQRKLKAKGTSIEMVDLSILKDMASRAGIKLVSHGQALHVWTYSLPTPEATAGSVAAHMKGATVSSPGPLEALITQNRRTLLYRPAYVVTYDLHSVYATSVGIVDEQHAAGASLLFDGNTGQLLDPAVVQFLAQEPQIPFIGPPSEYHGALPTFRVDATSMKRSAKDAIVRRHTKTAIWTGRNNQTYSREWAPGDRDIFLRDMRLVYLPFLHVDLRIRETPYSMETMHSPSGRLWSIADDLRACRVCGGVVRDHVVICDTCGRGAHGGRWLLSHVHGFSCRECGRTTCRLHGSWRRRALLFKALLCPACAEAQKKEGKVVRAIGPIAVPTP